MTATSHVVGDSATMLRRQLRHMQRYPSLTAFTVGAPVVLLVLFVFVFGGTLGTGLGGAVVGRDAYLAYLTPGVLLLAIFGAATGTAIQIATDMTTGIVARFRTMAITRAAVLTGHVLGSVLQMLLAVAVTLAFAVLLGFRTATGPLEWAAAAGLIVLTAIAISWLSVVMGLSTKSVETASNTPMVLLLLLFISSAFVPTASMPEPLAWFAANQPVSPIVETLRSLLLGTPGGQGLVAVAWCLLIAGASFVYALRLYDRGPSAVAH
jgi:ABC-2 type transport system permease protein